MIPERLTFPVAILTLSKRVKTQDVGKLSSIKVKQRIEEKLHNG
jgi:hypothetical protein